ncbi:hypothetical protein NE237_003228 [Protea cynaroides]|uniref:Uncharacterized protein n=1 Tax=Protea cynaroides TaxID=273540 RepID=A0A9Q0KGM8_9MAGN|nr:hypothetical protein NE237_003228 [Protea cynaroides]
MPTENEEEEGGSLDEQVLEEVPQVLQTEVAGGCWASIPNKAECETITDLLFKVEKDRDKFASAIPQLENRWDAQVRVLRQRAEKAEAAN